MPCTVNAYEDISFSLVFFMHCAQPASCGASSPSDQLRVNTHFGEILALAPKGLCCPARRAMITLSPQGVIPAQYGGAALLQDSRVSLGVTVSLDVSLLQPSLFFAQECQPSVFAPGNVVQMQMYA